MTCLTVLFVLILAVFAIQFIAVILSSSESAASPAPRYTPTPADIQEEREIYNEHAADGAFYAGATDYIDYDGNRRNL